jgi:hypothetical protein
MRLNLIIGSPRGSVRHVYYAIGLISTALVVPISAQSPFNEPDVLAFDELIGPGSPDVTGLEIGQWLITSQKFRTVSPSDAGILGFVSNGTPYIASLGGGVDYPITLERLDGIPFSLIAFDAAEGFVDDMFAAQGGFIGATRIEVEADLTSGFTVTLEFDLDGGRDGPDGLDDFESFAMPDELRFVRSITFTGLVAAHRDAGFALDNLVVDTVVPEPSAFVLAASATIILGGWRLRHSSKRLGHSVTVLITDERGLATPHKRAGAPVGESA